MGVYQERMRSKRVNPPYVGLIPKIMRPLKLFLDMVPSSSVDIATMWGMWMLSWMIKLWVKLLGLSSLENSASKDWLFLDPPGISETRCEWSKSNLTEKYLTLGLRPLWRMTLSSSIFSWIHLVHWSWLTTNPSIDFTTYILHLSSCLWLWNIISKTILNALTW